jgi:uncharacterized membrane protein
VCVCVIRQRGPNSTKWYIQYSDLYIFYNNPYITPSYSIAEMVLNATGGWLESFMQHCTRCNSVLEYGENTTFDQELSVHICNSCGEALR